MKFFYLIILSVFLSSCATMSKDECKVANWKDVGFNDGSNGQEVLLSSHSKSCAKVGVAPKTAQYMKGYHEGEKQYCTRDNGLLAGEKNRYVGGICKSASLKPVFMSGYNKGKLRYKKISIINSKKKELKDIDSKIKLIKSSKYKNSMENLDLSYRQKAIVNKEIEILEKELEEIK